MGMRPRLTYANAAGVSLIARGLVGVLALLGAATPTIAGAEPHPSGGRPSGVSTYGSAVVWSRAVGERYQLMASYRGRQFRLPARTRSVPFDADVGPGPGGGPVVVYSRCERDPDLDGGYYVFYYPFYENGRGCRLYSITLAAAHPVERALSFGPGLAKRSLAEPTIWRKRIAFATSGRPKRVYVAPSEGGRARRLRGGPVEGRRPTGLRGLDLRGGRLAFVWSQHVGRCGGHEPDPNIAPFLYRDAVIVEAVRTRRGVTTDVGCDDSAVRLLRRPVWRRDTVLYTATMYSDDDGFTGPVIRAFDTSSNTYQQAVLSADTRTLQYAPGSPSLVARDRYSDYTPYEIFEIAEVDPTFESSRRLDPFRHSRR
jgi:hypothetical protein